LFSNPGSTLSTMTDGMSLIARAKLDAPIEKEFAIADLPRFLGVVRLFKDPQVSLGDAQLTLSSGDKSVAYGMSDASKIKKPPTKELNIKADASFRLTAGAFKEIKNVAATLGYKELFIVGENGQIKLEVADVANPLSDKFSGVVGSTDKDFRLVINMDTLLLMPMDYDVDMTFKGIVRFRGKNMEYFVSIIPKKSVTP